MKGRKKKSGARPPPERVARSERHEAPGIGEGKGWAIAIAGFSLCLVLFLWPLFFGRGEPRWDARDQFYPSLAYLADAYAEGRFPLWDPYTSCGFPFHAEPQNPTLSPAAIVAGFLFPDSGHGFLLYWGFLWWMAGMGTIWTARSLGARPAGGFAAALMYAFSGFFVNHAQHTPYICVAAWLPWVFGLATKSVADSNRGYALLAGAALGLSSLGGYPTLVFFTGFALSLWLPLWFLPGMEPGDQGRTRLGLLKCILGTLCIVGAVAVLVWSPVLHAFFTEGGGFTERTASLPSEVANFGNPLPFPALLSLFFPYLTVFGSEWMKADISMTNVYLGAAGVPLAVHWWLRTGKRKHWGFPVFVVLMFLISLGGKAGVRILLYHILPPMRFMRFSAPFRLYWIFPVALAAGCGLSRLMMYPEERSAAFKITAGWLFAGIGAAVLSLLWLGGHGISIGDLPGRLFLPAAVALPAFLAALWMSRRTGTSVSTRTPIFLMLAVIAIDSWGFLRNNHFTVWIERDSVRQAEAFHKRSTLTSGEPGPRLPPLRFGYFNAQQVVKAPVVKGYITMQSRGFDQILCSSRFVEVMMNPIRFWLSPGTEPSSFGENTLEALSRVGNGMPVPVFVDEAANVQEGERTVPGAFGKAAVRLYSPERVELDVEVPGPRNAVLSSTERFAAGWKAFVDGTPANAFRVNLYFRGIFVPPGTHTVTWKYDPDRWHLLVGISLATLVLSIAGGCVLSLRPARK